MPRRQNDERRSSRSTAAAPQPYPRHALLQAIMARGFMPLSEAKALYMKLTEAQTGAISVHPASSSPITPTPSVSPYTSFC